MLLFRVHTSVREEEGGEDSQLSEKKKFLFVCLFYVTIGSDRRRAGNKTPPPLSKFQKQNKNDNKQIPKKHVTQHDNIIN